MATLKEQLEASRAKRKAAEDSVTESESQEQRDIREIAENDERVAEIAKDRRDTDLAKRLLAAKEAHPEWTLRSLTIKERSDTFIVRANPDAHRNWQAAAIAKASKGGGGTKANDVTDATDRARAYALASVVDFNGKAVDSVDIRELDKFLQLHQGLVTPITDAAIELNGAVTEERKR